MILFLTVTLDIARPVEQLEAQVLLELHEVLKRIPPKLALSKSEVLQKFTEVTVSVDKKQAIVSDPPIEPLEEPR